MALFVSKKLKVNLISIPADYSSIELLCVDIKFNSISTRIIGYYRPPGFDHSDCVYATVSVDALTYLCDTQYLIMILGDFNLPQVDWSTCHAPNNPVYNSYIEFINEHGLFQHVTQTTRGDSILDLVLSNDFSVLCDICTLPPISSSDHDVVLFSTPCTLPSTATELPIQYFNWRSANFDDINSELSLIDWNYFFNSVSVLNSVGFNF